MGQDPTVCDLMGPYILATVPGIWLDVVDRPMNRILVAQQISQPQMWISGIVLVLHVITNYIFFNVLGLGYVWQGVAATLSRFYYFILQVCVCITPPRLHQYNVFVTTYLNIYAMLPHHVTPWPARHAEELLPAMCLQSVPGLGLTCKTVPEASTVECCGWLTLHQSRDQTDAWPSPSWGRLLSPRPRARWEPVPTTVWACQSASTRCRDPSGHPTLHDDHILSCA